MTTLQVRQARAGLWTAAGWLAANLLGWVAGLFVAMNLGWGLSEQLDGALSEVGAAAVGWLIGGLLGGALLGVLQAGVLKQQGVAFGPWILATALGLSLGLGGVIPLLIVLFPTEGPDLRAVAMISLAGLILAVAQWLVLRRTLRRTWLWLPAGAFGMSALFFCSVLLGGEGRELVAISAGGLIFSAVTGLVLAVLPRQAGAAQ